MKRAEKVHAVYCTSSQYLYYSEMKRTKKNGKKIMMSRKLHNSRLRFKYNDAACMSELLSCLYVIKTSKS